MKLFSGFPSGNLKVTPLPNVFFSELCPAIDDLAELKLTLHCLWLFAHPKSRAARVTLAELRGDRTLMQSLGADGADPEQALAQALARATERGTLLRLDRPDGALYLLNNDAGRRAYERIQAGAPLPANSPVPEPVDPAARPNIFQLYEQNIGLLTPMVAERLKEAEATYPAEWLVAAFKIAVDNNKRSWAYVRAILERWRVEGRDDDSKKPRTRWDDEYDKFINR